MRKRARGFRALVPGFRFQCSEFGVKGGGSDFRVHG